MAAAYGLHLQLHLQSLAAPSITCSPSSSDSVSFVGRNRPLSSKLASRLNSLEFFRNAHSDVVPRSRSEREFDGGVRAAASSAYKLKSRPSISQMAAPVVEKGRYSYEVENLINALSALAPRGSIARLMDGYKKLTLQDFSLVYREFAQRGDWHRALRLFKYMQRQQWCRPTEHIYTIMIGIMGREGMLDKASELFEEMPANDVDWNVYSFTALINAYGRNGEYEGSLQLLDRMKSIGVAPNLITYNTVMMACAKGGLPWDSLIDLFAQMRQEGVQADIITYNTLLSACSSLGLVEEAGMVLRTLNEAGVTPDQVTFHALVEAYRRGDQLDDVIDLLKEMEDAQILPEAVAYNTLISAYGSQGKYRDAGKVFEIMKAAGREPNVSTYSALLQAYGSHGCYTEVRELVSDMKRRGTLPSLVTYNTLIDVFGRGGFFKEAVALFGDMLESGIELDSQSYSSLLYACGMGGCTQEATKIYRHMQRCHMPASPECVASLISAYGSAALYADARIAQRMGPEDGCPPDPAPFEALIEVYARGGLDEEATAAFRAMTEEQLMGSSVSAVNSLILAKGRAGHLNQAVQVFQNMRAARETGDAGTQAALLEAFCSAGLFEEAMAEFLEMEDAGLLPSPAAFCQLASVCARRGRWYDLRRVAEKMGDFRMPVAHRTVKELILSELPEDAIWSMVDDYLESIKVEGVAHNMVFFNAAVDALWFCGLHQRATRLLASACQRGIFPESHHHSETLWAIDVHRMSGGAAVTMFRSWLSELRELVQRGDKPPPLCSIIAKWGQVDEEPVEAPSWRMLMVVMGSLGAPFRPAPWNKGRFVCTGADLQEWLLLSATATLLVSKDKVLPSGTQKEVRSSTARSMLEEAAIGSTPPMVHKKTKSRRAKDT